MSNLKDTRPRYQERVAFDAEERPVHFDDYFNRWLDDLAGQVDGDSDRITQAESDIGKLESPAAFSVIASGTTSITAGINTKLSSWSEEYDKGGDFSGGTFTAPKDGIYHFCGHVRFGIWADQDRIRVLLRKNGSDLSVISGTASGSSVASLGFARSLDLDSGDTVELFVSNLDNNDSIASGVNTVFCGHFICAN